jgi:hypothetical protein
LDQRHNGIKVSKIKKSKIVKIVQIKITIIEGKERASRKIIRKNKGKINEKTKNIGENN